MSVFKDCNGDEWRVQLDAFCIADAKKETGIDLADLSAGGWLAVATDASAVGRILAVVCGDEIRARKTTGRALAKLIRGEGIKSGRAALLSEGADFFPLSEWSAIQSNLTKRKTASQQNEAAKMLVESPQTMQMMLRRGRRRVDHQPGIRPHMRNIKMNFVAVPQYIDVTG
jgi:hypothetical protein